MIFTVSFLLRIYWFWVGNNYARSGFPYRVAHAVVGDLFRQATDYLRLERGHVHLGHNSLGGAAYTFFVIFLGWCQIFTGMALYSESNPGGILGPPVRLGDPACWAVRSGPTCGTTLFAWGFVVFAILHVYIVLYDSTQYGNGLITSIVSGYKFYQKGDFKED